MNKDFIIDILEKLSAERPIFHSEADFQFSLAIKIKERLPEANIRLEVPYCDRTESNGGRKATDIVVNLGGKKYPIELKYLTKEVECEHNNERFDIRLSPVITGFFKDIERIEKCEEKETGYAILLTNSLVRFQTEGGIREKNKTFSLVDGKLLGQESYHWQKTKGKQVAPIKIKNSYKVEWEPYSNFENIKNGKFEYLLIEVKN